MRHFHLLHIIRLFANSFMMDTAKTMADKTNGTVVRTRREWSPSDPQLFICVPQIIAQRTQHIF